MDTDNRIFVGTSFERPLQAIKMENPPKGYYGFLEEVTETFVAKSTDYEHRYLRGLIELHARTIWAWEVDKKLDRLRTWLKRGELQVRNEGVRNSVDDLYVYTVQYVAYIQDIVNEEGDPEVFLWNWTEDRKTLFFNYASSLKPTEWVDFLVQKNRIKPEEKALQQLLRLYMGDNPTKEDWQEAIRSILATH